MTDHQPTFAAAQLPAPDGGRGISAHAILAGAILGGSRHFKSADREAVAAEIIDRARVGKAKYGQPLLANDGRDTWLDAWQEALDLAVYLTKWFEEDPACGVEWLSIAAQQLLAHLWGARPDNLDPGMFPQAPRVELFEVGQ